MSEFPQRIYFVAIGGSGMGSLACLLRARGLQVSGSDDALYPPMSTALERWEIPVHEGFRAEQVLNARPDLVVIGNAVRPDNPEARAALDEGLPYRSFPDALHELAMQARHSVVISGTHGKTTTSSLVGHLLLATGRDPSLLVGGHALDFEGSFREGQGSHFVVEGDEYDTAFFDKTPKFLHYHPRTLVVTSVDFDHADIYRDLDHVKSAFRELIAGMPGNGTLVAAAGHPGVRDVIPGAPCEVLRYGMGEGAVGMDFEARASRPGPAGTDFEIWRGGTRAGQARTPLYGAEGVENSLAALATCTALGVPLEESCAALPAFRGVKRRMEIFGEHAGFTLVDDFAHHPVAVRATLGAARARFPDRPLFALFEPRTNTSRRAIFQDDYAAAFDDADRVYLRAVPDTEIYSATGPVTERLDAHSLAREITARGTPAVALAGVDAMIEDVVSELPQEAVLLVMSNGDFDGIHALLLEALQAIPAS